MREERGDEGNRRHHIPEEDSRNLIQFQLSGESHYTERTCHEQLVGDRVYHRPEDRAAEPAGKRSVEQVTGGGGRENAESPAGVGRHPKRDRQRNTDRTDKVGRRPTRAALLALRTRTSLGHPAPPPPPPLP